MGAEPVNYAAVLADLEARKAKIEAAIEVIRQVLESTGTEPSALAVGNGSAPEIRSDSFFGMSIPDAAEKYLRSVRRPQSASVIAKALEQGGYTHSSSNFPNTVRASLNRLEERFVQVGKEWGLPEWYPGRKRRSKGGSDDTDDAGVPSSQP